MKYFTPELYVEFNSDEPAVADKADADWEKATADYRQHVRKNVVLLIYVLAEEPSFSAPHAANVFSDIAVHWLYDEVDATDRGVFSHDILLSNGRMLSVKFVAFDMLTVSKDDFDISRPDRIPSVAP